MKRWYYMFLVVAIIKVAGQEGLVAVNDDENKKLSYKPLNFIEIFNDNASKKIYFDKGSVTHIEAENFLMNLDRSQFLKQPESVKKKLKDLPPNEISFILYKLFSKKRTKNEELVRYVLDNCQLEFKKEEFNKLTEVEKKMLLENLAFPLKMADKCYKDWLKLKLDLYFVRGYKSLSPIGVAYFILLIFHSKEALSYAEESYVLSDRIYMTLLDILADSRFNLGGELCLIEQKDPFNYFKSKFKEKHMDLAFEKIN